MSNPVKCIIDSCSIAQQSANTAINALNLINDALEGSNYKGKWIVGTYALNDSVSHNGIIYKSDEDNNSDEPPSSKWTAITQFNPIDPALFGAKADGINDDTTSLVTALSIGAVDGLGRTYRIDTKMKLTKDTILSNCILDMTNINPDEYSAQEGVIEIKGSKELDVADITEEAQINSIKFKTDVSKFNVGDIIGIKTTNKWDILNSVTATYITKIIAKDSDYIYVEKMTPFLVPSGSKIDRIAQVKLHLHNVKCIGNVADKNIACIKGQYVDIEANKLNIKGFGYMGLGCSDSYRPFVYNSTFTDAHYDGLSYGVGITNCFNPVLKDINGGDMRHLITIGGSVGVTTNAIVENVIGSCREATIDSHPACDKMTILNSECNHHFGDDDSAIVFQGRELVVNDTKANSSVGGALLFQSYVENAKLVLKNNEIHSTAYVGVNIQTRQNVELDINSNNISGKTNKTIYIYNVEEGKKLIGNITKNNIEAGVGQTSIFIQNQVDMDLVIDDNVCKGGDYGYYAQGNASDKQVKGARLYRNKFINCDTGIRYYNSSDNIEALNIFENVNNEHITNTDSVNNKKLTETWEDV